MSKAKQQEKARLRLLMERALATKLAHVPKPQRLGLMIQAANHAQISDACWWQLLGIMWRDRDASDPMATWALLLSCKRKERYRFMRREEVEVFASLPAELMLYCTGNDLAPGDISPEPVLAWRVDGELGRQKADAAGAKLLGTRVQRRQVLATVMRGGAVEVVLLPNGGVTV